MKQGLTIQQLVERVEAEASGKHDYSAKTTDLVLVGGKDLGIGKEQVLHPIADHAHRQISEHLKIPGPFYKRLKEGYPDVLDYAVNTIWRAEPKTRMVRTLGGYVRAYLSNRYARRDNIDLIRALIPDLIKASETMDLAIESCELTFNKLYIKFTTPRLQGEVQRGDVVQAGGIISNSEVGMGYTTVFPFIKRLVCSNGMTLEEYGTEKRHVGKQIGDGDEAYEIYSDETMIADDTAFWLKIRDTVRQVLQPESFGKLLGKMQEAAGVEITNRPDQAVEELAQRYSLNQDEQSSVLQSLLESKAYTKWGLSQAITSTANNSESYERASELEALGGKIITLPASEWQALAA